MKSVAFVSSEESSQPRVVESMRPADPTGSDVLVAVAASSINGSDLGLRRTSGLARIALRGTRSGFDVAGTVVACGPKVTAFDVGDRVMGLLGHRGGGHADYVSVPQRRLALIPDSVSATAAACLPLAGLTALQALRGTGRPSAGADSSVLVIGAAGGIGSFAVQLAKIAGAEVTAMASATREEFVRGLGADRFVDRSTFPSSGGGVPYDLVIDATGRYRFAEISPTLAKTGMLVSTRPISSDSLRIPLRFAGVGSGPGFAVVTTTAASQDLSYLARLVERDRLLVPIDRVFPLAEVEAAFRHAESGELRGKVALTL